MNLTQDDKEHKVKVLLAEPKAMAKQRLIDFAVRLSRGTDEEDLPYQEVTYTELISRATDYQTSHEYWSEGGRFEGQDLYDTFWEDYELVTQLPVKNRYGFFSCSC